jgi:hypothetical protein
VAAFAAASRQEFGLTRADQSEHGNVPPCIPSKKEILVALS